MSFKVLPVTDKDDWERFLDRVSPQSLFQGYLWGEVQESLGNKVWRLSLMSGGKLAGIAQVVKVEAKRGKFLHLRHGPVISGNSEIIWNEFLTYLKELAQKEKCWFIRVSPLIPENPNTTELFRKLKFTSAPIHAMDAEFCWILDIEKDAETLLSEMRKTTRYEIRSAQKLGVEVKIADPEKDLSKFLDLYRHTSKRHGFVPHAGIKEELKIFSRVNKAILLLGYWQGEVLSGAIILFWGNQAIYHHGASIASRIPVSYLIQWQAIMEAKKRGYKFYNFWGIAPGNSPDHPWSGITLFKKGFGGREVRYVHAQDLPVSRFYALPRTVETVRRIMKGY